MKIKDPILNGYYDVIHSDNNEIETFKIPLELQERVKNGMGKDEQKIAMIKLRAEKRRKKPERNKINSDRIEFKRIPNTLLWHKIN